MSCKVSKSQLMSFFFEDDLTPGSEAYADMEKHVAGCEICRRQLAEFRSVSGVLRTWQDETPEMNMVFTTTGPQKKGRTIPDWINPLKWPRAAALAGSFVALLLLLSAINFQLSYDDNGFQLKMGLLPPKSETTPGENNLPPEQLRQWQQETLSAVQQLVQAQSEQQNQNFQTAIEQLAQDFQLRRENDLRLVSEGLETLHNSSQWRYRKAEDRFRKTDRLLQQIMAKSVNK